MADNPQHTNQENSESPASRPGLLSVLQSVLAAMFGVQSEAKREEDFEKGNAADYVLVGIIMVVIFVLSIVWFVNSTIADYQAGG